MTRQAIFSVACLALLGCTQPADEGWLGYIEAETALVAPPQGGWINSINVMRGAQVNVGDSLFQLDAERETATRQGVTAQIDGATATEGQANAGIAQANARRVEVEAMIIRTERELARQRGLVEIGASLRRDLEAAQAAYDSAVAVRSQATAQARQAEAQVEQARALRRQGNASLATAETNLSERDIRARVAGRIEDIYFREGEFVAPGTPVVAILPQGNVFVRFFIPEPALSGTRLGSRVRIACDGCPADLTATISFIATEAEFTPPIIYSVNNRQKLVFKAEARTPELDLRPGLPVSITLLP